MCRNTKGDAISCFRSSGKTRYKYKGEILTFAQDTIHATKIYNLGDDKILTLYAVEPDSSPNACFEPISSSENVIAQKSDAYYIDVRCQINRQEAIMFHVEDPTCRIINMQHNGLSQIR